MADQWYYTHEGDRHGPFTGRQLRNLAESGTILRTDTVFKHGVERGVAASAVKNLFVLAAEPVPAEGLQDNLASPAVAVPSALPDPVQPDPVQPDPVAPAPVTPPPLAHVRKRTATAGLGAVVVSQDGVRVRFKKRCTTCQKEDTSVATATIQPGLMREWFFCPGCRKRREVHLNGRQG